MVFLYNMFALQFLELVSPGELAKVDRKGATPDADPGQGGHLHGKSCGSGFKKIYFDPDPFYSAWSNPDRNFLYNLK